MPYLGRFAPSPTGPLHAGSLVAALASWLDARAHRGLWRVRIEDVDTPRCRPGAVLLILQQLAECGLVPDGEVLWQSSRGAAYQRALDDLLARGLAYPCACSRTDIARALRQQGHELRPGAEVVYPGTCRAGLGGRAARAWRLALPADSRVTWHDAALGEQTEDVARTVGDFVLKRADGLWAYQLAVVVDDAAQGITDVVRGADLVGSTARQILLQRALGLPTPRYRHVPLVRDASGAKLSKQDDARPLVPGVPALREACAHLGLGEVRGDTPDAVLASACAAWRRLFLA